MKNPLSAPHPFFIATSEQSQEVDTRTIKEFGIDGFTLMEVAGYSAAQKLLKVVKSGETGLFFCGKGNNAGDALVVARYLLQHGINCTLVFISGIEDMSVDTQKNFDLLSYIIEKDEKAGSVTIYKSWDSYDPHTETDFIVDGMLGTGLNSEVRGNYNKAIQWINDTSPETKVYAIDIPTGLHGDSGQVMGSCISADTTFSFGTLKQGFYLNDGPAHCGETIYCELPFPNYLKDSCSSFLIDSDYIQLEAKSSPRHKYEAGVLYVIAGSEGLTGAAMLAAESAWAQGIGAVILVCPHGNLSIYEKALPQIIKKPVGERDDYFFKTEHLEEVTSILKEKNAKILIGPGLGRQMETTAFVHNLLENHTGDFIIDADALWSLAQKQEWKKPSASKWILTPHPGELATISHKSIKDDFQRLNLAKSLASNKAVTLVSKGFPVILGVEPGECYITDYDTRKFSRAGFGDVLAGKIGAYWSQGYSAEKSSALALLNGKHILDELLKDNSDRIIEPKDFI